MHMGPTSKGRTAATICVDGQSDKSADPSSSLQRKVQIKSMRQGWGTKESMNAMQMV